MAKKILTALIIDDRTLFRDGIAALLKSGGIKTLASLGDGAEGIGRALKLRPDLVLLDLRAPGMSGIEVLLRLREKRLDSAIVILTMSQNEKDFRDCIKGKASGYLLKDMDPDELAVSLRRIHAGELVVAPAMRPFYDKMKHEKSPSDLDNQVRRLTAREKEILVQLAAGLSNKRIASKFGIADGTVKLHVKSIFKKLNVHSRVEAAVIAIEEIDRQTLEKARKATPDMPDNASQ